jgi:hypothetical protein
MVSPGRWQTAQQYERAYWASLVTRIAERRARIKGLKGLLDISDFVVSAVAQPTRAA